METYISNNYLGLPDSEINGDALVDARTPVSYIKRIERNTTAIYGTQVKMETEIEKLTSTVHQLQNTVSELNTILQQLLLPEDQRKRFRCNEEETNSDSNVDNDDYIEDTLNKEEDDVAIGT